MFLILMNITATTSSHDRWIGTAGRFSGLGRRKPDIVGARMSEDLHPGDYPAVADCLVDALNET